MKVTKWFFSSNRFVQGAIREKKIQNWNHKTKVKENERKASGFLTIVQVPPFVLFMENEDFN